jgi:hypothetical protein
VIVRLQFISWTRLNLTVERLHSLNVKLVRLAIALPRGPPNAFRFSKRVMTSGGMMRVGLQYQYSHVRTGICESTHTFVNTLLAALCPTAI